MSNVVKLKKRALDYEQKKQFDRALDTYMQVLDVLGDHVDEADVALFNRVGDLLLRQGNVASAVDHYERAVDLYTDGGFHNNAIALCNKILRNAPGRSSIYYKLGRISAKKGFINDAKQNFLEYADRMQRIGQFEEAFRALKEFADLCPDQDDIRLMLADQLVRGDRKAEAIEQLQFLFEKFDSEGRTREAKATLERMKAIDPEHEPKPGVARPTPKFNDLIFLDVNYDGRGRTSAAPSGDARPSSSTEPKGHAAPAEVALPAQAEPPAADATVAGLRSIDVDLGAPPREGNAADSRPPGLTIEPTLMMVDGDSSELSDVPPIHGLSSGAGFGVHADAAAADEKAYGIVSHTDSGFITGFEETSLGGTELDAGTIEPVAGIEHAAPIALDEDAGLDAPTAPAPASTPEAPNPTWANTGDELMGGDDLPMIDISLDFIDDAPASPGNELNLIFPDDDAAAGSSSTAHGADVNDALAADGGAAQHGGLWSSLSEADLNLEPLLQLPDIRIASERGGEVDPAEAQFDEPSDQPDYGSLSIGPELQFLSLGEDEPLSPSSSELTGYEYLDIAAPEAAAVEEPAMIEEPAVPVRGVEAIRAAIELYPGDWELHRRLAEALLEEGDRDGGLAAFEAAMLGFERAGDIRGANAVVEEMIRVEPREVRFHQKRVEYAVRANDRSLLADAYFSLAESLFQMGDLDKSRAVYARVLELSPNDARARSALEAIGDPGPAGSTVEPASAPHQSSNGVVVEASISEPPPVLRPKEQETETTAPDDFVNLSDWLREDAPTRNTRMVVDVTEPEIDDQVDFAEMLAMFKQGVAANVDESDHEAHYDLGVAYKEMGLLDEAISEFQKALRGTERRARTYEALGQCFVEKGQHQIAVTILSRALGDKNYTDDMLVGVLYLLGYASETLGRWADAQRFYERVFAVDIEFRDIAERLAVAERGGR